MVVISLLSLVVSFLVFMGVRFAVYSLNPSNYLFADILIIIIGSFIVSLIFAIRQFRYMEEINGAHNSFTVLCFVHS